MIDPRNVSPQRMRERERGTALVMATVAIIGLMLFSVFVIDYGIVWVSRTQAQAAADAGALAGAVSIAYEDPEDLDRARNRAIAVTQRNRVWNRFPTAGEIAVSFPVCPDGTQPCVQVDVTRLDLPSAFANLLGVVSQRVFATATAQATVGTRVECVRPFGLPDRWDEFQDPEAPGADYNDADWNPDATFDRYPTGLPQDPLFEDDVYVPPSENDPGTGYRNAMENDPTVPRDYGRQVTLKLGTNDVPGWSRLLDLDGTGGADIRALITGEGCGPQHSTQVADPALPCSAPGDSNTSTGCITVEPGQNVGPVTQGVRDLIRQDAAASWDGSGVAGSAFETSPRIVPIPVFDPDLFYQQDPTGKTGVTKVTNLLGIFIEGTCETASFIEAYNASVCDPSGPNKPQVVVLGRIMNYQSSGSGGPIGPGVSFLRKIQLVR